MHNEDENVFANSFLEVHLSEDYLDLGIDVYFHISDVDDFNEDRARCRLGA